MSVFSEICPVGAKLYHAGREAGRRAGGKADGPTGMTKLTFRQKYCFIGRLLYRRG